MSPEEITIRDLYPELSGDELKEAEEKLGRYLELMLRLFERLEQEQQEL